MLRHSKLPWDTLLVACLRVILRPWQMQTSGPCHRRHDNRARNRPRRSPICINCAIKKVAAISGAKSVFLLLVHPENFSSRGRGLYQPAPEISAWYRTAKTLKKQGVPKNSARKPLPTRIIPPKNNSPYACLKTFKAHHPMSGFTRSWRMRSMARRRLSMGPGLFGGVQVLSQSAANQNHSSRQA